MGTTPEWELSKENAAPLQRGRNVAALERATLQKRDDKKQRIDEFERLVRPSEAPFVTEMESDPIVHWLEYIKYFQEYFPSDTNGQFLLMERCTRALVKMSQYADDARFIGVCAKYADKAKDPGQIFKFLHQQKVGRHTALFWCAWAFVAEKANDFPFAEQVYKKGIAKNAQPLDMLQVRHKQFQRRMSRHWLNSSQANDCLDEEEEETPRRGALGGLSRQSIRRNHRSNASRHPRDQTSRTSLVSRQNNNEGSSGAFPIYVEQNGENADNGYNLDQSFVGDEKRELVKDADRKKENLQDPERWNENGGIRSVHAHGSQRGAARQARAPSSGPPPPFAVFVDEECAAQYEQQAEEQRKQADRRRCDRDERTFRERKDEGMAEKLAKDPLRYVLDPSQLETDQEETKPVSSKHHDKQSQSERKGRSGFNKRLLKDRNGAEQCFEEARASGGFFKTVSAHTNFNHLHVARAETSGDSQMDIDEDLSSIEGGSMAELVTPRAGPPPVADELPPKKFSRLSSSKKAPRSGPRRPDASFESGLNQTAISTASSTLNEAHAVGLPTGRDEQTINTKFALKELSMMFSSPAFGAEDAAPKTRHSHVTGADDAADNDADLSTNMAELVGNMTLDNSILGPDPVNEENGGPRNPFARTTDLPDFEGTALRQLDSDVRPSVGLGCHRQVVARLPLAQHDPLRGPEIDFSEDAGFKVYEDDETKPPAAKPPVEPMFQIFQDDNSGNTETADGARTEPVASSQPSLASSGFAIYQDDNDVVTDDNTATLSLVGEVFDEVVEGGGASSNSSSQPGMFSIFVDDPEEDDNTNCRGPAIAERVELEGISQIDFRQSYECCGVSKHMSEETDDKGITIDYDDTHENDSKAALRWLEMRSSVATTSRASIASMLSTKGVALHLSRETLPKQFRQKRPLKRTGICIGKHTGEVAKELGRGSYGVVVLMDVGGGSQALAVKAQSSPDSLAWEYKVLKTLEERAGREQVEQYPFPRAHSCILLADGAILSMTAGSKSGLNLVDLANLFKLTGKAAPEILALHYTSRMLKHMEKLHVHGRILHCDVKPDNFVLSTSYDSDNLCRGLKGSELMLVDFGRAIDLKSFGNPMNTTFSGEASGKDMRCVAMRCGKPWSFDIDTYGILCSAHVLLFGTHMEVVERADKKWKPRCNFPRYWERGLWQDVFDRLLNLEGPSPQSLRMLRERIDARLGERKRELWDTMKHLANMLPESRDKL